MHRYVRSLWTQLRSTLFHFYRRTYVQIIRLDDDEVGASIFRPHRKERGDDKKYTCGRTPAQFDCHCLFVL